MASYGGYVAFCAKRGNKSIKKERVDHYCSTLHIGQPYNVHLLRDDVKSHLANDEVCNGETFSVMITKGKVDHFCNNYESNKNFYTMYSDEKKLRF